MSPVSESPVARRVSGYHLSMGALILGAALGSAACIAAQGGHAVGVCQRHGVWDRECLGVSDEAIVFADFPGGGEVKELYLIAPDGSGREAITSSPDRPESQPSWSPSRREVAYSVPLRSDPILGEVWGIEVLDLTTRLTRTLTAGPLDVAPDWSPDGRWIAFSSIFGYRTASQGSSISVVASDGSELRPLVELRGTALLTSPAWSPDGQRIAFSVGYADGGELYQLEVATGRVERLFSHPGMDDIDPAWSPDGRRLAFASGFYHPAARQARHDIWVLDLDSRQAGTIASHSAHDLSNPAWSPDGVSVVYCAEIKSPPGGRWELYLVPLAGGGSQRLLTTGVEPDWESGPPWAPSTPTGAPVTSSPSAEPSPGGPLTPTPPAPPTLTVLPTLPAFPTRLPGEPTATLGTPPTFAAPVNTATATEVASATRPAPTVTSTLVRRSYLPYAASDDAWSDGRATATPAACLHREVEPNDSLAEADRHPDLCDCVPVRSALPPNDPEDLFGFTIELPRAVEAYLWASANETVAYELALYPRGLFDPVARGEALPGGGRNRVLRAQVTPGRYYLRVQPAAGLQGSGRELVVAWCTQR